MSWTNHRYTCRIQAALEGKSVGISYSDMSKAENHPSILYSRDTFKMWRLGVIKSLLDVVQRDVSLWMSAVRCGNFR
jgi:hypothetical protein